MKYFQVVLAACVCATSAQLLVGGYAGAVNPNPSTQFHAQDEFGQFSFGHAGGPSARTEVLEDLSPDKEQTDPFWFFRPAMPTV